MLTLDISSGESSTIETCDRMGSTVEVKRGKYLQVLCPHSVGEGDEKDCRIAQAMGQQAECQFGK
jgi:hypothetical protein